MKKPWIKLIPLVWAIVSITSCIPSGPDHSTSTRIVKTSTPSLASHTTHRSFSGTIVEATEINLSFRVAGPIVQMELKEGDFVEKGELIARIDPRDYETQLTAIQAQYDQMKSEYERLSELRKRESISENDYEKAAAGEKMLRMQLQNAQNQLHDTRLVAPYAGHIQRILFREGELVDAGMPIANLLDTGTYLVELDLPMSLFVRRNDFEGFWLSQPMVSETLIPLKLSGYQMKAGNTRLFKTTLLLDPANNTMFAPGMSVEVKIQIKNEGEARLTIPQSAVFYQDGETHVWKYNSAQSTIHKQVIVVESLEDKGLLRVVDGLYLDDEIVVSGVHALREGQRVKPMEPDSDTNVGGLM